MSLDSLSPLCSVVMPVFNAAAYLAESIESVRHQTCTDWELILVDDGSSDSSLEIAEAFVAQDHRIRLLQQPENKGAAEARNRAIAASRGRYLAFLDSDDLWRPQKLAVQIEQMQQQQVAFSFSHYSRMDVHGQVFGQVQVPEQTSYEQLLKHCFIGCLTVMLDREQCPDPFFPPLRKRQDFALWLKLLKQKKPCLGIQQDLALYRCRRDSLSANKRQAAWANWRLYRDVEQLSWPLASYYFVHYAVRSVYQRLK